MILIAFFLLWCLFLFWQEQRGLLFQVLMTSLLLTYLTCGFCTKKLLALPFDEGRY